MEIKINLCSKRSGKPTLKKIESYFEQTMKDIDLSFSHINHITGKRKTKLIEMIIHVRTRKFTKG